MSFKGISLPLKRIIDERKTKERDYCFNGDFQKHNPVDLNKKIEDLKERINKYIDTVEIDEDLVTYAKYLKILDSIKK